MLTNITSLTGNGLKDWLIQRITAVYFGLFSLLLLAYFILHPYLSFVEWQGLFSCTVFQISAVIAFLSFVLHAWIGLWTVTTDYLKSTALRLTVQGTIFLMLLSQLIWGLMIVWRH